MAKRSSKAKNKPAEKPEAKPVEKARKAADSAPATIDHVYAGTYLLVVSGEHEISFDNKVDAQAEADALGGAVYEYQHDAEPAAYHKVKS